MGDRDNHRNAPARRSGQSSGSNGVKIGIIGAGSVGIGIGARLAAKGHDVVVSFAHIPEKVARAAAAIGGGARAGSPEEAAAHGDVVIFAPPWSVTLDVVRQIAEALSGKLVWDTTNPLKTDMSGLAIGLTTSAGEEIAKAATTAIVVKAVPPFAELLQSPPAAIDGHRPGVFVCGDDPAARAMILSSLPFDIPLHRAIVDHVIAMARNAEPRR
ncbi:F420-dependent NADP oxidoreductase [Sphingomonas koreensis]|nr:F420-dependent NADP oxidoreductase [Sphingomonas koreensis]